MDRMRQTGRKEKCEPPSRRGRAACVQGTATALWDHVMMS